MFRRLVAVESDGSLAPSRWRHLSSQRHLRPITLTRTAREAYSYSVKRMQCVALGGVFAIGTLLSVDDANSFLLGPKWEGWAGQIRYPYKLNVNSFSNNLPGLSLTSDQVRFWVGFAMGQ